MNQADPIATSSGAVPKTTAAINDERIEALRDLFPEAFTDGVLNAEAITAALSDDDGTGERYGLSWAGKQEARQALSVGTSATLHPQHVKSTRFWDRAENSLLIGDNLEVLRLLQRCYNDKIRLIYIDPPYNTGNDFVYRDNFTQGLDAYLEYTGQVNEDGSRAASKSDTGGRRHSNWLSMIYPRLALARNLLTQDGAIFVSIDDNEVHNLRLVMDEVFGPENFIGQFVWAAGRKNDSKFVSQSHEYIVVYARNQVALKTDGGQWRSRKDGLDDIYATYERLKRAHGEDYAAIEAALKDWYRTLPLDAPAKRHDHYNRVDARGIYFADNISWPGGGGPRYEVLHPTTRKPVRVPAGGWRFTEERMRSMLADDLVHFGADETSVPCQKAYLKDRETEVPYSVFYQDGRGATKRLRTLLGGDYFENPKDETVLQRIVEFATDKDSLVLDFFAGSGSMGHAVMAQNKADGGNRKFILVTLDEATPEGSNARNAGMGLIPDITFRRLCKAAEDLSPQHGASNLRTYRLGRSNFKTWDPNVENLSDADALAAQLGLFADNHTDTATPDSIVAEVALKEGLPLNARWTRHEREGEPVVVIDGQVAVCPTDTVDEGLVEFVVGLGVKRAVMLEAAFTGADAVKSNAFYRFNNAGITFRTI